MNILVEQQGGVDVDALDRAWSAPETFAFLPSRTAVSREWVAEVLAALPHDLREGHFALLTSGSTGTPKLVIGSRERAEALARALHVRQRSESLKETIVALPLSYCYAFVNQWLWSRVFGRRLVLTRGMAQRDSLHEAMEHARDAMLCLVGTQAPLIAAMFPDETFPGIVRLHFAGGAFPQKHLETLQAMFPAASIFNNYGCAEAMPRLTVRDAADGDRGSDVGTPLPGIALRTGSEGQLEFLSPFAAVAFADDEGFRRVRAGEWLPTGDLGSVDDRGHWHITGRANEVFKRHGEKIALPALLQSLVTAWSGAAMFYRERDPAGEEAHVLVLAPRPAEEDVRGLLQILRARHVRAQWPLRIESVETFPTLPSGKYDAAAIAALPGKIIHWRQRL